MRLPNQDVRSVDQSGRATESSFKFNKSIQRFMWQAGKLIETAKAIIGHAVIGSVEDKGDGTLNAEALYDNGERVLSERARQTLKAGFDNVAKDHGTVSGGTLIIDPLDGQYHKAVFNGALTLQPAAVENLNTVVMHVTNGATPGAVTFKGFTKKYPSQSLNTVAGHRFAIHIHYFGALGADYAIYPRQ